MCVALQQSYLPGKSANYNIKAVSTSDLFAFALYAITLNQERSVVDVGLMQNNFFSSCVGCLYNWISSLQCTNTWGVIQVTLHWILCFQKLI